MEQKKQILSVKIDIGMLSGKDAKKFLKKAKRNIQSQLGAQLEYYTVLVIGTSEGDSSEIKTLY